MCNQESGSDFPQKCSAYPNDFFGMTENSFPSTVMFPEKSVRAPGTVQLNCCDLPNKKGGAIPRPLTKDEIYSIVENYAKAAKRAQIAGFDAVEIHCGHSYLISQFFLIHIILRVSFLVFWKKVC